MIGVVAKLKIQAGKEEEFEKIASELIEKVQVNEPGCTLYELFKGKEQGAYVFMEKYSSKEALAHHGQTEYFLAAQPAIGGCLAGAPEIEVLSAV